MLTTPRLILRPWREDDRPPFAQMSADPEVMRYFPKTLSRTESDALADRLQGLIAKRGYGFWATEVRQTGSFIGFVGLHHQPEESGIPGTPFIEVGWRLTRSAWGQGYATEAARAALTYAFTQLGQEQVYAFTTIANAPSRRVMRRLGMRDLGRDFDHPRLPGDHPLVRHCLFGIHRDQWTPTDA